MVTGVYSISSARLLCEAAAAAAAPGQLLCEYITNPADDGSGAELLGPSTSYFLGALDAATRSLGSAGRGTIISDDSLSWLGGRR